MAGAWSNHLWQSTWFAIAAGLLTVAFRKNRAHVRFWLWFSASIKFFVPFALLMSLGSHLQWAPALQIAAPPASFTMEQIAQPFPAAVPLAPGSPGTANWAPIAIFGVWACGFAAIALWRFRSWLRIHTLARGARTPRCRVDTRVDAFCSIRYASGLLEPSVIGVLQPILLLPEGIEERLTPPQLEAVLAHELCHIRRRDNLFAAIHMVVEAVFWFHPLVWWIGSRLVEERERACDEEVLRLGSEPHDYAEGILNVCKLYVESSLVCVSGVTGSDLKKRIEAIMTNRIVLRLNFAKKVALAITGAAALALPIAIGLLHAPSSRAQSAPTPKFEVASVKPCKNGDSGGRGGRSGSPSASAGRIDLPCRTVKDLIQSAYLIYANGHRDMLSPMVVSIEGGPAWIDSEHYQVSAKAESAVTPEVLRGPMMQALLEDRFQLKIRRETRGVPAFDLTAAKGGPKLHPTEAGSCIDISQRPMTLRDEGKRICGSSLSRRNGPNITWTVSGMSLADYAKLLSFGLGRPVIDKIGTPGMFDLRLVFAPDESISSFLNRPLPDGTPSDDPPGPTIFTALQQQLGLKLDPSKGPREFLVIDRVERPTEN